MTTAQIKNIHIAYKQVGFSDAQYRLMLANVAGVSTSKALTNEGYEDCMALLEDHGFRQFVNGEIAAPNYWRKIVARRGAFANGRLLHRINELHAEMLAIGNIPRYSIQGLCLKASDSRTLKPADLTPREASNLIEMLKAIVVRASRLPPEEAKHEDPKPTKTHEVPDSIPEIATTDLSDEAPVSGPLDRDLDMPF